MGLDTTHDCWHGSYGSFSAWRRDLASIAGLPYPGGYNHLPDRALGGDWTDTPAPEDALVYLLWHSDIDGEIRPEQAMAIANRLDELKERQTGYMRQRTKQFVAGLREAIAAGESVEFY